MINFKNTYIHLPENFYKKSKPSVFPRPSLIIFNHALAKSLGINSEDTSDNELALIFSGQKLLAGSEPIAMAYAGYQFGNPVAELGDGRAHLLGEVNGFDIQLKGSGQTPFSRRGDGRSALGPVLREYIVSEAMHALGVPTTRALCAVSTGENVYRQFGEEPGGIFTRVASGHLRVGTFQYFYFQNDIGSIEKLLNYAVNRHYPELSNLPSKEKALKFINKVIEKQSDLIAKWSSLGFIHGVMNTDNFSVAGITIDYGPCAFMDEFKLDKVFSSIDRDGRYAYSNQVPIAQWNIYRLAECFVSLIDEDPNSAVSIIKEEIKDLMIQFSLKRNIAFANKLGIINYEDQDEALIKSFLQYLEKYKLDFTLAFRNLPDLYNGKKSFYPEDELLNLFISNWKDRVKNVEKLNSINPLFIPRNHQIEKVIQEAYEGDYSRFHKMIDILKKPFDEQHHALEFATPPAKDERVTQTFCGT